MTNDSRLCSLKLVNVLSNSFGKPTNSSFPKKKHKRRLIISSFPFPTTRYAAEQGVFKTYYSPSPTGGTWHRLSWNAMEEKSSNSRVSQVDGSMNDRTNRNESKVASEGAAFHKLYDPSENLLTHLFPLVLLLATVSAGQNNKKRNKLSAAEGKFPPEKKKKSPATPIVGRFNQIRVKSQKIELHFEWIKFEF